MLERFQGLQLWIQVLLVGTAIYIGLLIFYTVKTFSILGYIRVFKGKEVYLKYIKEKIKGKKL